MKNLGTIEALNPEAERVLVQIGGDLVAATPEEYPAHVARPRATRALLIAALVGAIVWGVAAYAFAGGTFQVVEGADRPAVEAPSAEFTDYVIHESRIDESRALARARAENAEAAAKLREAERAKRTQEILSRIYCPHGGEFVNRRTCVIR